MPTSFEKSVEPNSGFDLDQNAVFILHKASLTFYQITPGRITSLKKYEKLETLFTVEIVKFVKKNSLKNKKNRIAHDLFEHVRKNYPKIVKIDSFFSLWPPKNFPK